ncbi:MAG: ATP-binding cassette domain-containing protein, partial [Bacteroidia bacterium]|nr:ATP-binding cassette domain-containing protein [Bacteroidia bacterium]
MHYTGDDLFAGVSFLVREKDRIGLVGKNGAGKTTLLKLIAGLEQPHKGDVVVPDGITIGYLPQEMSLSSQVGVLDEALKAFDEIRAMHDRVDAITALIHERTDYESNEYNRLISELSHLNERLALMEAYSLEGQAEQVLLGLGFEHEDMQRPLRTFSNGWQMRVELAKILLKRPSLVLLDEPTNHLDIESIQWLESYLKAYYGAVLLVSHDRAFLDAVTNRTIEISGGKIFDYKASYSDYVEMRQQRIETQTAAYENQQREIRDIERFIERFRYKASKARQVQSRVKMLEKMEEIGIEEMENARMRLRFPPAPHSGKIAYEVKNLHKQYDDLIVLDHLDLTLSRGEKVAFVGRNGEGKTTLARIMAGVLPFERGEAKPGHLVKIGYYAQNQHEMLDGNKTVFETLDDVAVGPIRTQIKNILGAFLFSGDAIDKKVKVLSGGEKARLSLARLLLSPVNFLILDEPTNHLDMA